MTLEADLLLDRRRLKRRVSLWRALAVVAALGLLAVFLLPEGEDDGGFLAPGLPASLTGGHVARLPVEGFISDDRKRLEQLERAGRDPRVKAVILSIDSPGGSVVGGEALHATLARLREHKPVVAVMGGTAASAGYMIALPAHRVFAREATVTGSIGVLLQSFDASELLARIGVRPETLASGPFKAQPSPLQPLSEEGRAELMRVVRDLHAQFVALVAAGRRMPVEQVQALADGRIFTGRQALEAGLIDAIGGEQEARAWLAEAHGVPADLPVRELERRSLTQRTFGAALGEALGALLKSVISEWLGVDGVWAVWQPPR